MTSCYAEINRPSAKDSEQNCTAFTTMNELRNRIHVLEPERKRVVGPLHVVFCTRSERQRGTAQLDIEHRRNLQPSSSSSVRMVTNVNL